VNGPPGSGKTALAGPLARTLGLPLLSKDVVKEALLDTLGYADRAESRLLGAAAGEVLWAVLADCPDGAVVESWLAPGLRDVVRAGLVRAGVDQHVEVWCECPADLARERYAARRRHPGHFDAEQLAGPDDAWATAEPLGLGPVLRVATHAEVDAGVVAAEVRGRLA
jgi:predicted kinase